jgi:hypothetical protein
MNFWKRMRLVGNLVLLVISIVTIVMAIFVAPDPDNEPDNPTQRPALGLKAQSGTSGL